MNTIKVIMKVSLAISIAMLGMGKLVAGYSSRFWVPSYVFYGTAVFELLAACWIAVRPGVWPYLCVVVICLAGAILGLARPSMDCGCLAGIIQNNVKWHLFTAGVMGTCSSFLLGEELRKGSPNTTGNSTGSHV